MKMDRKTKGAPPSKKVSAGNQNGHAASTSNETSIEKQRLQLSDNQFANIIEKINEGFVALDAQMNYLYINR